MRANKSYLTLERVVLASSVGISALELLFDSDIIIVHGNDYEFELIKIIEELMYNQNYDKLYHILK
jgi:hypothetical protein